MSRPEFPSPTPQEKRAYFEHILTGEAEVFGGLRITFENGRMITTNISAAEALADEKKRVRENLGLPPEKVLPDRPSDFRITGGHEIRP